jgi:hypothetical protein
VALAAAVRRAAQQQQGYAKGHGRARHRRVNLMTPANIKGGLTRRGKEKAKKTNPATSPVG